MATASVPQPEDVAAMNITSLYALWQVREAHSWSQNPDLYRSFGERALKLSEPLLAYDVLTEGLKHSPSDLRLRQLLALALVRSGAADSAEAVLSSLRAEGHADEETLGLLARVNKERWLQATEPAARQRHLHLAYKSYLQAYTLSGGYWTGINAATLALLAGQKEQAATLAGQVREFCLRELDRVSRGDQYWLLATLGEAALISGSWAEAEEWYARAGEAGQGRLVELASSRRNARLIMESEGGDRGMVERHLLVPRVVVFAGHMIDRSGRAMPRFPPELEGAVRESIKARLKTSGAGIGYSSAANGADILFLEALLELGGEAHVVLPYNQEQFVSDSVDVIPGGDWRIRFERILGQAAQVITASEQKMEGGGMSYEYVNLLLQGLATIKARQLETELVALAVWDGTPGDGPGGTASTVAQWRESGLAVEVIDLAQLLRAQRAEAVRQPASVPTPVLLQPPAAAANAEMRALLFADAYHFSKLSEPQLPLFLRYFMGGVGELLGRSRHRPVVKNTWGDGLYLVFSGVEEAGQFALELSDLMNRTDWREKGLPDSLNLRIALHAGPVYACVDPVTGQPNYIGTHVSRAARIEPVTPPGKVYASQAFAAISSARRTSGFVCEYVGQTPLAKGYGTFPTYHVRRSISN